MTGKVIVFGAHGKVGQNLIKLLGKPLSTFATTAIVRNNEQAQTVKSLSSGPEISTKQLTLDNTTVNELAGIIKGHSAVVLTVGSAGKNLLQVDLDGVVKTFEALVQAQVKRLVLISAIHADDRENIDKSPIRNYFIAKHYADRILQLEFSDKLDFTILKPGLLTDEPATGKVRIITSKDDAGSVTRADVAQAIVSVLEDSKTYGKSYDFVNGDTPIESAFN